jgi:hypothetical protein
LVRITGKPAGFLIVDGFLSQLLGRTRPINRFLGRFSAKNDQLIGVGDRLIDHIVDLVLIFSGDGGKSVCCGCGAEAVVLSGVGARWKEAPIRPPICFIIPSLSRDPDLLDDDIPMN